MSDHTVSANPRRQARIAGLFYLVIIVAGAVGYTTHSMPIVWSDAAATAENILASEQSWRLSTLAMLIMLACDVVVAGLFYFLFLPVNRTLSLIACAFRLVLVAVVGVAILARYTPLFLLKSAAVAAAPGPDQAQALSLVSIRLFEQGFTLALVFFGFHCLALGWLIFRSDFLPRVLGTLLLLAGLLYLVDSFRVLVVPTVQTPFDILIPSYVIEMALCLWLIVVGVNSERWKKQAGA